MCYNIASVLCFGFWPRGMWDLRSLTGDWNCTTFIERQILNHWTTREVPKNLRQYKHCQSVPVSPRMTWMLNQDAKPWMLEKWRWQEQGSWKPTGRGLAGRVVWRGAVPCHLLGSWTECPVWSCRRRGATLCLSFRLRHQLGDSGHNTPALILVLRQVEVKQK